MRLTSFSFSTLYAEYAILRCNSPVALDGLLPTTQLLNYIFSLSILSVKASEKCVKIVHETTVNKELFEDPEQVTLI